MTTETQIIAQRLGLPEHSVATALGLMDDGATIPFISRYRKEATGGLDEVALRAIDEASRRWREFVRRRQYILETIEKAGALTTELADKINATADEAVLEDLYLPYKPRRRTRAQAAREKGLEPLAKIIMAGHSANLAPQAQRIGATSGTDADEALAGARDIIAEWFAETARLRGMVRRHIFANARFTAKPSPKAGEDIEQAMVYKNYFGFDRHLRDVTSHQYLAIRRAEREGFLKVAISADGEDTLIQRLKNSFGPREASPECRAQINMAVDNGYRRLMRPSMENEVAQELKERSDRAAIDIFAQNLRQLLLAPPLRGLNVMAIDPGYRTGCKVVCLSAQGELLADTVIYPVPPHNDTAGAAETLKQLCSRHAVQAIAVGNGTAGRETEKFVRSLGLVDRKNVFSVSENGASVYSASPLAREEFPDKDVTVRGAVSIGRRLIDPLAELVKIDPKSIGVGQYQHDVDQAQLKDSLDFTVLSCVNTVGVNLNTASAQLLAYVSGIGHALATKIIDYRSENGRFLNRHQLLHVPRLGQKAFEQCAGFIRIPDGDNPLDNTGIHPENYYLFEEMGKISGLTLVQAMNPELWSEDAENAIHNSMGVSLDTIREIHAELLKPGHDPRIPDTEEDIFDSAIQSFEDLAEGMVVEGIVNNITDFGAFIDLGIKENGLLHISKVAKKRVTNVGEVLKIGQRIRTRIIELDPTRRRISLSIRDL